MVNKTESQRHLNLIQTIYHSNIRYLDPMVIVSLLRRVLNLLFWKFCLKPLITSAFFCQNLCPSKGAKPLDPSIYSKFKSSYPRVRGYMLLVCFFFLIYYFCFTSFFDYFPGG